MKTVFLGGFLAADWSVWPVVLDSFPSWFPGMASIFPTQFYGKPHYSE